MPARPEYIQTNSLHDGGKPHSFHATNAQMFDTGSPVEFRHGRLDPGPVPIFVPELGAVFFLPSPGQTDILVGKQQYNDDTDRLRYLLPVAVGDFHPLGQECLVNHQQFPSGRETLK